MSSRPQKKPARKQAKKTATRTVAKAVKKAVSASLDVRASQNRRNAKIRAKALSNSRVYTPATAKYTKILNDPFESQPYPLGFGTAVPTSCVSAFRRQQLTFGATATAFALRMIPTNSNLFWQSYQATAGSAALSASLVANQSPTNGAAIAAVANQARVIAAGIRVTIRYPTTGARGTLVAIPVYSDSIDNLQAKSFDALVGLESAEWGLGGGGEITMQACYRPLDLTSYEFGTYTLVPPTTSQYIPMYVIVGTGWPAGTFTADVSMITHFETIGGLLGSASDNRKAGPATADEALSASSRAGPSASTLSSSQLGNFAEALHRTHKQFSQIREVLGSIGGYGGNFRSTDLPRPQTPSADEPAHDFDECKENEEATKIQEPISPESKQNVVLSRSLFQALTRK